jgi:hypothetical protein
LEEHEDMQGPLPLDTLLGEFSEEYEAWIIQSKKNGEYLIIPDDRFPGRRPIRFFMSAEDASRVIDAVLRAKPSLSGASLWPVKVRLHDSLRRVAADKRPDHADSFVMHSPNEVFEFVRELGGDPKVKTE